MVKTPSKLSPEYRWQEIWAGTLRFDSRLCLALLGADGLVFVLAKCSLGFTCTQEKKKPPFSPSELSRAACLSSEQQSFVHPSALTCQRSLTCGCAWLQVPLS